MAVTARYRPGAVRTPFVDREDALSIFDRLLGQPGTPRLLAVHLHKMAYLAGEEAAPCAAWERMVEADQWPGWQDGLAAYRAHERVKSAVVGSVRYAQLLGAAPEQRPAREASLVSKLNAARQVWGNPQPIDPEQVTAALDAAIA